MGQRTRIGWLFLAAVLTAGHPSAQALETDQFYAWGKPIEDSTEYLNAWMRLTVQDTLDSLSGGKAFSCEQANREVQNILHQTIFQPIEMWAVNNDLVDRIPRGYEENREYRENYLLANTFALFVGRWLNPSPTVEVNGVRFGTDKLAHFVSVGAYYYRWWKKHQGDYPPDRLERKMLRNGTEIEWWAQGMIVTGVVSMADMEANYQGYRLFREMCHGDPPLLEQRDGRWIFSDKFDFRNYVSPDWDESWNPNIYNKRRWKGVRVNMLGYCPQLHSPWVERQRALYRQRDVNTPLKELVAELVSEGKLKDPRQFDITTVCEESSE